MSSPPSTVSDVQQKAQDENPMINQLDQVALSPPQTFSVQTPVLQHSTILDNEDHGHDQDDEEAVTSKYPYLSPDGEAPRRILSSHSLIGENIDDETTPASFRRTSSGFDSELSPFTPTSQEDDSDNGFGVNITNNSITPPLSIQEPPASLSPPLFTTYRSSDSVAESSLKEPVFHQPSPQFHHLQPRTHMIPSIGYGRNHNRVQPSSSSVDATLRAASEKLSVATAGTVFNQHTSSNNSHSLGMGKPFLRPPRAPQSSSLQSSPYRNGPEQLSTLEVARLANSTNTNSGTGGAGHSRVPTDSTNFTFMSALTDATAEYGMPRRRTKSLDETQDTVTRGGDKRRKGPQQNGGNTKRIGRGTPVATEHSTSGVSLPGSILQPILSEGENTPPISILASNLKKPLPAVGQPTLIPSTSSVTEGMCTPIARIEESVLFPPTRSVPRSSLSVSEGMSNDTLSEIRMGLPRITLSPRSSIGDRSPLPPFLHPQIFENNFTEKKVNDAGGKNDSRHPSPSLEATSGSASLMGNGQTRQRHLADSPEAIDVIQNTEKRSILVRMVMNTESFYAASLVMLLVAFGIDLRSLIASLRGVFVGVAILLSTLGQKQLQVSLNFEITLFIDWHCLFSTNSMTPLLFLWSNHVGNSFDPLLQGISCWRSNKLHQHGDKRELSRHPVDRARS